MSPSRGRRSTGVHTGQPESVSVRGCVAADGSFQFGAMPSPGYLFIRGPSDDYVLHAVGTRMVQNGEPGGHGLYAHSHTLLDLKPGIGDQELQLVLRRGAIVTGHVVGPDSQPVPDAWIFSRVILDPSGGVSRPWLPRYHGTVRNGSF